MSLYYKIEHIIFDCENIFLYLPYLDLIKLRLVSKKYDKRYKNYIHSLDPNNYIKNSLLHFEVKCKLEIHHNYKLADELFKIEMNNYMANKKNEIKLQIKKLVNQYHTNYCPHEYYYLLYLYYHSDIYIFFLPEFEVDLFRYTKDQSKFKATILDLNSFFNKITIHCFYNLKKKNKYFVNEDKDRQKFFNLKPNDIKLYSLDEALNKLFHKKVINFDV